MLLEQVIQIKKYTDKVEEWKKETSPETQVLNKEEFLREKEKGNFYVAGMAGFADDWKSIGDISAEQNRENTIKIIHEQLDRLVAESGKLGKTLIVCSGATNDGTLEEIYKACAERKILAMGVTTDILISPKFGTDRNGKKLVGQLQYLISFGNSWGDESEIFTEVIDEIVVMGGGEQSYREMIKILSDKGAEKTRFALGFGSQFEEKAKKAGVTLI
jgi:siroheme synthase (precorrin-2 oxidase/ferrochelatase)